MDDKKRPTSIRVDPDLWEKFKGVAKAQKRSVRAQIELMMEEAVKKHQAGESPKKELGITPARTASIPVAKGPYFPSTREPEENPARRRGATRAGELRPEKERR